MQFSKITVLLFAGLASMASAAPRAEPNPFVPVIGRQGPPPPSGTGLPPPPPTGTAPPPPPPTGVIGRRQGGPPPPPFPSGSGIPPPPQNGTSLRVGRHRV